MGAKLVTFGWVDIKESLDKKSKQANLDALAVVAERVIQDTEPFVPKKTGRLRSSATVVSLDKDGCEIQYSRPLYVESREGLASVNTEFAGDAAEYLYEGINPVTGKAIQNWTTAGTGGFWFEVSKEENQDDWYSEFTRDWIRSFTKRGTPENSGITR